MSAPHDPPLVHLEGVTRLYDGDGGVAIRAVDDLSLQIRAGEFVCLVGPSGCGKSTLINILGCLDRPTAGTYRFAGVNVAGLDSGRRAAIRREEIGFVFQAGNLLERRSARENVELPAAYTATDAVRRRQRADNLLDSLGLASRREHKATELSGGERQRVALARALMNEPRVVLADEPTGALDTKQQADLLGLFADLARRGHAVLIVSHDANVAAASRRRIEMRNGRIVSDSGAAGTDQSRLQQRVKRLGAVKLWAGVARDVRAAVGSLLTTPLCSTLGVLSVALGVGCMTAVLGVAEGVYEASRQFVGRLGADRISVSGLSVALTPSDADANAQEVPHIRAAIPALSGVYDIQYRDRRVDAEVIAERGVEVPEFMYEPYPVERGILLSQRDQDRGDAVMVIGPKLREGLFAPDADPIGETVLVGGVPFQVKAVLAPHPIRHGPPYASSPVREVRTAWVPFRAASDLLFPPDARVFIDAYVDDALHAEVAARDIRDLLIRRHGQDGVSLLVHAEMLGVSRNLQRQDYLVLGGIGAVALIVSGLGVMASMLAAIGPRSKEIGLRVAVGARRRDIIGQFLSEAAVVGIVGALGGMAIAWVAGPAVATLFDTPVAFTAWFLPAVSAVAMLVGVAAGVQPAFRAAGMDPVHAMGTD